MLFFTTDLVNNCISWLTDEMETTDYMAELIDSILYVFPYAYIKDTSSINILLSQAIPLTKVDISMNYDKCVRMAHDLSKQIAYLNKHFLTIYAFNLDDIMLINGHFVIINNTFIAEMNTNYYTKKSMIMLNNNNNEDFMLEDVVNLTDVVPSFAHPDLLHVMQTVPFTIHADVAYYGLAKLIIHCIGIDLEHLKDTKLYWFLQRCLSPNPTFLFI